MRVVIIGSGNVATVLGKRIVRAGHEVVEVWSRNLKPARELAVLLNTTVSKDIRSVAPADLYILAVTDAAVQEISAQLNINNALVVHTAGSVSINSLETCSANTGVLYPLQSIRKERDAMIRIPLLIDGNNEYALGLLNEFASSISNDVRVINDEQRLHLHVAAVILNNFSNHLYTLATDYCGKSNIDFSLLLPLITETGERLTDMNARDVQTGPAVRKDTVTINRHLSLLEEEPDLREIYTLFTEKIISYYGVH